MPDTQETEDTAQAEVEPTQGTSTATAERTDAEAEPKPTETTQTVAELQALLAAERAEKAKAISDAALARKAQSALQKDINTLRAQGDPVARERSLTAAVEAARAVALAKGEDAEAAAEAVRNRHKADDTNRATEQGNAEAKTLLDNARAEMGAALTEAGLSAETDWNDEDNEQLQAFKARWVTAINNRDYAWANRVAEKVKALKKAAPEQTPTPKTARQRAAELALADTGAGGASGGLSDAAYRKLLKEGKPLPSAAEIDRLTAQYLR